MPFSELVVREQVQPDGGRPRWVLVEPLRYVAPDGTDYVAEEGFDTDFASVPFFVEWLVPRSGRHNKAAVTHDKLWRLADAREFDRGKADFVFRGALKELGVSFIRRWMMWTAVRQGSLAARPIGRWTVADAVGVVGIMLLFSPIVVPTSIVVVGARAVLWILDVVPSAFSRAGST